VKSPIGELILQPAGPDDLEIVLAILDDAAVRLNARGIRQWSSPSPEGLRNLMEREIHRQHVYLARTTEDGRAVGTVRFEWTNPPLWRGYPGDAGYVYSLAIGSDMAGLGIGALILEWAREHIRSRDKRFFRLDCVATNLKMREYYEKLSFALRGTATHQGYQAALYEMKL